MSQQPAPDRRIVAQGVLYLRGKPNNDSEQVSQLLLGSAVTVLREDSGWAWVQGFDTYRGWADCRQLVPESLVAGATAVPITTPFGEVRAAPDTAAPLVARLPQLARVYPLGDPVGGFSRVRLASGAAGYLLADALTPLPAVAPEKAAAHAAACGIELLGTPYLWGGSSTFGIDCSGFVQLCYLLAGRVLRRDADMQRRDERFDPAPLDQPRPGDLIFFGSGPERITHIGIALADGSFIHAAGGRGVIVSPVQDDRYWPRVVDARRLNPDRADQPIVRYEAENR